MGPGSATPATGGRWNGTGGGDPGYRGTLEWERGRRPRLQGDAGMGAGAANQATGERRNSAGGGDPGYGGFTGEGLERGFAAVFPPVGFVFSFGAIVVAHGGVAIAAAVAVVEGAIAIAPT
jgi:hypothetical protein